MPARAARIAREIRLAQKIAVRQHARRGQQPEPPQRLGIGAAAAGQHMLMLPVALGAMGLHRAPGFRRERAEAVQKFVGAGRDEARGDDRLDQARVAGQHARTDAISARVSVIATDADASR